MSKSAFEHLTHPRLHGPRSRTIFGSAVPHTGLAVRHRQPELMDQPTIDPVEHARALRGLGRINGISRSSGILWPAIAELARAAGPKPVRVLDLASGGGDVPLSLAKRAARAGLNVQIEGCDVSPQAVLFARWQAGASNMPVRFFELDAVHDPLPGGFDVVMCSLFLHHLEAHDAIALLRRMAAASRRLVLVNDLYRSVCGYLLAWVGCRLLSRSHVVHFDGPTSVAGAFTPEEALELAGDAGLEGATMSRHWPCRYLLSWKRA
jgi:2-polyprenyl-3-methyl-5-hydroxy-6-metoxy-1,4-benzoquinol methylase